LLTLRGAELLKLADVVVYDVLVNPALLRLARDGAEIISRGKRTEFSQEQINDLMIAKAREGKIVVRLKGGDPYIFGRGGEEAEALAAAKISFEVVPGVSSIVAAPNYAGIPLTHREHCSSFTVFTGHENPTDAKTNLSYEQIAKIPGSKVVLMGTENLGDWTKTLIANGMSPETPVAIVQSGTVLTEITQRLCEEWAEIARARMDRGFDRIEAFLQCRTPQDFAAGWGTLALLNAGIAQGKNRSGLNWFLLSLLLGPIASLVLVAFMEKLPPKV